MTRGGGVISLRGAMSVSVLAAGDGPFVVGIANKDLTLAELSAYLEQHGPVHPDDTTNVEVRSRGRKIRKLGLIVPRGDGTQGAMFLKDVAISGLRFSEEAAGWSYWLYNMGKDMTTGALWLVQMDQFVRWNRGG